MGVSNGPASWRGFGRLLNRELARIFETEELFGSLPDDLGACGGPGYLVLEEREGTLHLRTQGVIGILPGILSLPVLGEMF